MLNCEEETFVMQITCKKRTMSFKKINKNMFPRRINICGMHIVRAIFVRVKHDIAFNKDKIFEYDFF